jgi:Domain of unknown function (DUF4440)
MNFKVILNAAIGLCLITTTALAQKYSNPRAAVSTEAIEKEILRLEEVGRLKALRGDNDWDDLMAEGAYMIVYDGSIITYQKGQRFPPFPMKAFNMSEMIARVYGDVVVVTGLAEIEGESAEKKPFSFKMRFLNVWKQSGDGWKIVVSERTGVKAAMTK